MAQDRIQKLDTGAPFPALTVDLVSGGSTALPIDQWTILLVYRGHW